MFSRIWKRLWGYFLPAFLDARSRLIRPGTSRRLCVDPLILGSFLLALWASTACREPRPKSPRDPRVVDGRTFIRYRINLDGLSRSCRRRYQRVAAWLAESTCPRATCIGDHGYWRYYAFLRSSPSFDSWSWSSEQHPDDLRLLGDGGPSRPPGHRLLFNRPARPLRLRKPSSLHGGGDLAHLKVSI